MNMTRAIKLALATAGIAMSAPTYARPAHVAKVSAAEASHNAETARNRVIVAAFVDMFYHKREVEKALLTFVSPNYIQHAPAVPDGREVMLEAARRSSPSQAKLEVKRVMVDGDMAIIHVRGQLKPTMPVEAVIDMFRLKDGKIVEHWSVKQPVPETSANTNTMF